VIIINKGEKVYDDAIKNLTKKYQQNRYLRFVLENNLSEKDIEKIRELATIEEETDPKDNVYLFKTNQKNMMALVNELTTSDNNILDMQIESVPLEDVIADLFRA
jgi:ABC-type uncharacterized transport system ATPase subunit